MSDLANVRAVLLERGLLLLSDNRRPALAQLVAGGAIRGSWWGHEAGHAIFAVASALEDDPDVTTARLVDGKVTFVHRDLFGDLVSIGREHAPWQTRGLAEATRRVLRGLAGGSVASDDPRLGLEPRERGAAFGELGARLLAAIGTEHGERGAHRTVAVPWDAFAGERGVDLADLPRPADARERIANAIAALGGGRAPWDRGR